MLNASAATYPATAVPAQQVTGVNDPLPAPRVRGPGGRHRADDEQSRLDLQHHLPEFSPPRGGTVVGHSSTAGGARHRRRRDIGPDLCERLLDDGDQTALGHPAMAEPPLAERLREWTAAWKRGEALGQRIERDL